MATKQEKKEFALSQLAPYLADPSTCGIDEVTGDCEYLTPEGNMCVAGKNMIEPKFGLYGGITDLLADNGNEQKGIFKPEVVDVLSNEEWRFMQLIHDSIAKGDIFKHRITQLNLFTYNELVERAEALKKSS